MPKSTITFVTFSLFERLSREVCLDHYTAFTFCFLLCLFIQLLSPRSEGQFDSEERMNAMPLNGTGQGGGRPASAGAGVTSWTEPEFLKPRYSILHMPKRCEPGTKSSCCPGGFHRTDEMTGQLNGNGLNGWRHRAEVRRGRTRSQRRGRRRTTSSGTCWHSRSTGALRSSRGKRHGTTGRSQS